MTTVLLAAITILLTVLAFRFFHVFGPLPEQKHMIFESRLWEMCARGLFIAALGLAAVGEIVERARGIRFPWVVEAIPAMMISALLFLTALTEEGWKGKLKGMWGAAIVTLAMLLSFYWVKSR